MAGNEFYSSTLFFEIVGSVPFNEYIVLSQKVYWPLFIRLEMLSSIIASLCIYTEMEHVIFIQGKPLNHKQCRLTDNNWRKGNVFM